MNGDPSELFGFDLEDLDDLGASMITYLERAWRLEHDGTPLDLDEDLDKLRPLFQSHVTGNRVRDYIKTLPRIPLSRPFIPETFFLEVDAERGMVTPEGRGIIEAARLTADDRAATAAAIANAVALFYGESLRTWMAKSVETGLVPLPSVGFTIFLLINGSIGEPHAMRFPNQQEEEADLAKVVMNVASTFSSTLHGPPIKTKERTQLRTSWVVSQAVRHLGRNITRGSDKKTGVASIWVEASQIDALLDDISVAIRARGKAEDADVLAAFDAAVAEYEDGRVILGAWGISHERRRQTQQLRQGLLDAFQRARS